jgi:hypothetical protein
MSRLEPQERECLARVAQLGAEGLRSCDDEIIRRLLSLRLIEETVEVRVALPMLRRCFRATVMGRAALEEGD